jgi:subtilisin family serine protease
MTRYRLDDPPFADRTGRGVTVAVIDSGIHAAHPHIGGIAGGVCLVPGADEHDFVDRIGHGTAVAAAIKEKSPAAELIAVRVFDRQLATTATVLADAIRWSADQGARLINLSLGTINESHAPLLRDAVRHAASRGAVVVSAREADGSRWFPGSLEEVAGVGLDSTCERDEIDVINAGAFAACGYPRPIPGVPPERNLSGISFAVANVTGFLARALEDNPNGVAELLKALAR